MKFCVNCGKEIDDSAKFCPHCGNKQPSLSENETKAEIAEVDSEIVETEPEIIEAEPEVIEMEAEIVNAEPEAAEVELEAVEAKPEVFELDLEAAGLETEEVEAESETVNAEPGAAETSAVNEAPAAMIVTEKIEDDGPYDSEPDSDGYRPGERAYQYRLPFDTRSIPLAIILSIVTCGIYQFYWIYQLVKSWNYISVSQDKEPGTDPALVIVLTIVTCGIYGIYYWYKMSEQVARLQDQNGDYLEDNSILCIILALFGFSIVAAAIHQNMLNFYIKYGM